MGEHLFIMSLDKKKGQVSHKKGGGVNRKNIRSPFEGYGPNRVEREKKEQGSKEATLKIRGENSRSTSGTLGIWIF